ncbi:uncharacterized protein [Antedon mediterranea]|uniref:uncharacterized protein n=1 Tax=Antedon mediterranea TaxID=105859 RepID=UPI003AF48026
MAKAQQEIIQADSPCVRSGGDGEESVARTDDNMGLESRTCSINDCRNGPNDRSHREFSIREIPKNHQNSHGMDCDGSCHMKSEPILNNEVDIAAILKEKLNLNGMNISPSHNHDHIESLHIDALKNSHSEPMAAEDECGMLSSASGVTQECLEQHLVLDQQTFNNAEIEQFNHEMESTFDSEYELPENINEPFSVASLIPAIDGDIDSIPGEDGEDPVKLIAYESEKQIQSIMALITKDLSEPYSIYTYRYFIHNWPNLCFLAMHESTCVGAIVCKLDNHKKLARRGYIAMLAVDQAYRKRKIGSNLVIKAIRTMIRNKCDEVVLETEITNKPALRLYENLGFVRDKRLFRYYLNGVDALRLKLWLR